MKKLAKILRWTGITILILVLIYVVGPTPSTPIFAEKMPDIQGTPTQIAQNLAYQESQVKNLKPDNEARVYWADTSKKEQTAICIVYLHGFFASQREGLPTALTLAKHYKANLICNRMPGHGIADKDAFLQTTPESMWASAQEALAIGQRLGKRIILIGTSTGGSLAILLASKYPKIMQALVLYSPLIDFYEPEIWLLYKPWGLHIVNLINGSPYLKQTYRAQVRPYWTTEYRAEGAIALCNFVANTMFRQTFQKIKIPTFVGAYYKDDLNQDKVVSVPAIRTMFRELGTEAGKKKLYLFPEAGHHVIGCDLRADKVGKVAEQTVIFLKDVL